MDAQTSISVRTASTQGAGDATGGCGGRAAGDEVFLSTRLTNARTEGINRLIKQ